MKTPYRATTSDMEELPKSLRYAMIFIDRVGFPTLAFLLMSYICFVSLKEQAAAMSEISQVLTSLGIEIKEMRKDFNEFGAQ